MAHSQTPIFAAAADWQESFKPIPGHGTLWNAHRPLLGALTWTGASRYGVHYAYVPAGPDADAHNAHNRAMDGRQVLLLTNAEVMDAAEGELQRAGYELRDYFAALQPEAPGKIMREVAGQYGLPWSDADSTADERMAALQADVRGVAA